MDRKRQQELEQAYLPEWHPSAPDALTILEECALQMLQDSYHQLQHLMEYQRTCFYQTIALQKLDEKTFTCCVCFTPSPLYEGIVLAKGTRLYVQKNQLLEMELLESVAVQHAQVDEIICYHPLKEQLYRYEEINHISLFKEEEVNEQCFSFSFSFRDCFEQLNDPVFQLSFIGRNSEETNDILHFFGSDKVIWQARVNDELTDITQMEMMQDCMQLQLTHSFGLERHHISFHIQVISPRRAPHIILKELYLTIPDQRAFLTQVIQNEAEQPVDQFPLFDHPLSLFQTTYLRAPEVLARKGSIITWKFQMEDEAYPVMEELIEKKDYRLFMRKLPKEQIVYDVKADRIQLEYFNGEWISLPQSAVYSSFAKSSVKEMKLIFTNPLDIHPYTVNGILDYWIRIVLVKADNCYQIPAVHHIPTLRHHRFTSHAANEKILPADIMKTGNGETVDLLPALQEGIELHLFEKRREASPCIFLRFHLKPSAPFRMYCRLRYTYDETMHMQAFTYVNHEEVPLLFEDETHGFMRSGKLSFAFPQSISPQCEFQKEGYYVKLVFEEWQHPQIIEQLVYHCADAGYQETEERMATLVQDSFPIELDVEGNVCSLDVLEQQGNTQIWVPWTISFQESQLSRHAQRTAHSLKFTYTSLYQVPLIHEQENIRIKLRKKVPFQKLNEDDTVFLADQTPQISTIKSCGEQWIGIEAESSKHLYKRQKHYFLNHAKGCSLLDIKRYLQDMFPDIEKLQGVYGYNRYQEISDRTLCLVVVWKHHTHYEQEVLQLLKKQIALAAYRIDVQICAPLLIAVDAYVQFESGSGVAIEAYLKTYFHSKHGNGGNGWQIGEYAKQELVLADLQQRFPQVCIAALQLYGNVRIRSKQLYLPLADCRNFACGLLCPGKIEIEVMTHEI